MLYSRALKLYRLFYRHAMVPLLLVLIITAYAQQPAIDTRVGHTDSVNDIAFSPDGKMLVSAGGDKTIRFWDLANGKELRTIQNKEAPESLAFTRDGRLLVGGLSSIRLLDLTAGRELKTFGEQDDGAESLAVSPNQNIFASGEYSVVKLWNLETGEKLLDLDKAIYPVAFSPDGKILATASGNDLIRLWNPETGERIKTFEDVGTLQRIAFSPDGQLLLAAGAEGVRVLNILTGKVVLGVTKHSEPAPEVLPTAASFSPDGKMLALGDTESIKLVTLATGEETARIDLTDSADSKVIFSPDGKLLADLGSKRKSIDISSVSEAKKLRTLAGHSISVQSFVFNSDGRTLLGITFDGTLLWWDLQSGKLLRLKQTELLSGEHAVISPNGKLLARGGIIDGSLGISLTDLITSAEPIILKKVRAEDFVFSADGKTLITTTWVGDRTILVWNVATGTQVSSFNLDVPKDSLVLKFSFSPNGKVLAIAGDKWVKLLDVSITKELGTLPVSAGFAPFLVFSPDGKTLCVSGADANQKYFLKSFDLASHRELYTVMEFGFGMAFSPDGKLLATLNEEGKILLLNSLNGKQIKILATVSGTYSGALSFSNDGKLLAVSTAEGLVIFEVATGKELFTLA